MKIPIGKKEIRSVYVSGHVYIKSAVIPKSKK